MTKLEDYASEPGKSAMDLVLFRYSMRTARQLSLHACRQACLSLYQGSHVLSASVLHVLTCHGQCAKGKSESMELPIHSCNT